MQKHGLSTMHSCVVSLFQGTTRRNTILSTFEITSVDVTLKIGQGHQHLITLFVLKTIGVNPTTGS